jgi:hydroxylaminobenzene mutase
MAGTTDSSDRLPRHAQRLLQAGALLFLLALFVGLGIPGFTVPRLALSAHLLGLMQGTFLIAVGLLWPRLGLTPSLSGIGCGLAIYGCVAAWTANVCGAAWGAGSPMLPMAAAGARGSALQEGVIRILLLTAAPSLIAMAVLILWGLRSPSGTGPGK